MSSTSSSFYTLLVVRINFVLLAPPLRVRSTFVELLIGVIISGQGISRMRFWRLGAKSTFQPTVG